MNKRNIAGLAALFDGLTMNPDYAIAKAASLTIWDDLSSPIDF